MGLTKSMSVDLQGKVRVNSISPAAIDTPMLHDGFNHDEKKIEELYKFRWQVSGIVALSVLVMTALTTAMPDFLTYLKEPPRIHTTK